MKLVLAEKPSVAQSIAKVLDAGKREDGYLEGNRYVTQTTAWYSKHPPFLIIWIFGTILELISRKSTFISKNSPFSAKN